ncbi:MAG TPA: hypothetical protein VGM88_19515 [Kofleriaceae bacterium]|jgi:hypothetical protein
MLRACLLISLAACTPKPGPAAPAGPVAPTAADSIAHWKVAGHALSAHALVTETDALAWHGRAVEVTATSYQSPWSGTCDEYGTATHPRALADATASADIPLAAATGAGLTDPLLEVRLSCNASRTPALTLFVAPDHHAMTCWSGACYFLRP